VVASHTNIVYEFCSAESAKRILTNRTLRWSTPALLRDPLELDHTSRLTFTQQDLLKGAIKTAISMIFAREAPKGNAPLLAAIRRWRDEERFNSPEEAENVLQELLSQMVDQRQEAINKIMSDWQDFTKKLRICCFCSKWDNLVDWQLRATNHAGVVLRFELQESKSFGEPRAITYVNERPAITTIMEQLNIIINNERFIAQEKFSEKFSVKATSYQPQHEVRCFYQLQDSDPAPSSDPSQWFSDREFEDDALKGVYFGLNTSLQDKQAIWDLVKSNFTGVKLNKIKLVRGKYDLEAERLTEKPV
jgi:hypothetical protein